MGGVLSTAHAGPEWEVKVSTRALQYVLQSVLLQCVSCAWCKWAVC